MELLQKPQATQRWLTLATAALFLGLPAPAQYVAPYVILQGTLFSSSGIPAKNATLSFQPSQVFFVGGTGVVVNGGQCSSDVNGSVVGIGNPYSPPIVSPQFVGTLPVGNYYVKFTWYDQFGGQTLPSVEVAQQLTSVGELHVLPPAGTGPPSAVGMDVYIGSAPGAETYQGQTVTPTAQFTQAVPLATGANPPIMNSSACRQVANDAGWPTGTGYKVSLVDASGNVLFQYPQLWQLLGPGSAYNLSNGIPYYNGQVTYPIPVLTVPYNHNVQSISGPIDMTAYNIVNLGALGVGTKLPAWGVDVEGSGTPGAVNARQGYLINGQAGAAGSCPISDGNYFDLIGSCGSGLNVLDFGAFCDSNGTTGNGHNDRAAIQALLNTLDPALGGQVVIPAGHICRIASTDSTINTDYLSVAVSNFEMTGGGRLFFDPVLVSGHPTFGTAISGIYAAGLQIYSPGCTLSPVSNPQDVTTGRAVTTLISNVNLHDFSMSSVGSYNSLIWNNNGEPTTNIPLNNVGVAIWCANNVQVKHMNLSNFYSDAIEPWGVIGLEVSSNLLTQDAFSGIGTGWTSDATYSDNVMVGVGQGMETDGLRSSYTGNTISNFAMSGIEALGGPSANTNISATISGNTLTRDTTVAEGRVGISISCNGKTSTCVDSANVGPNTITGNFGAGIYVQPGTAVSVHDNAETMTAMSGTPVAAIQLEEGSTWGVLNPVSIIDNHLAFSSTVYQAAIYATGLAAAGVQSVVRHNTILSTGFAGGTPYGVYLFSTGIACQQNNLSTVGTPVNSVCNDGTNAVTGVRKDCLSVACVGGSTYVSGTTYTNSGAVPVEEFVGMTVTGSCTGYAAALEYTIDGAGQAGNGVYNICAGVSQISFKVLPGETFSATAATLSGSGGTPAISSWSEIVE
jgi:hypothetical protein